MDVRIFLISKREHPSTIKAKKEEYGETRGKEFGETQNGDIDFRIQGLPHSTVQQVDGVRRGTVKKLIHQFETHPNRESLMADLDKKQKFNLFSEKSKELIRSMEKHGVLRDVRDHFQNTMPRLLTILGHGHCILYLRQMLATFRKTSAIGQRSIWCLCQSTIM